MDHYQEFDLFCNPHGVIGRHEGRHKKSAGLLQKRPALFGASGMARSVMT
jgi:hypothetical protein